jgi:hypothetical protein
MKKADRRVNATGDSSWHLWVKLPSQATKAARIRSSIHMSMVRHVRLISRSCMLEKNLLEFAHLMLQAMLTPRLLQ